MITFTSRKRIAAIAGSAALLASLGIAGASGPVHAAAAPAVKSAGLAAKPSSCHLGNGVKHVVQIVFDNVHFFRDNPNVPSDLELLPNLLHFIEGSGTMLSNNHTPLIAHTATDILTTFTGLYGDRQGMGIANGYQAYNHDGPGGTFKTTDSAASFAYWTDPVFDTSSPVSPQHDTNPSMVYSPVPPATARKPVAPTTVTPAPWVPFTRAGCDAGYFSTANTDLENSNIDLAKVFGPKSPEYQQYLADKDSFKDAETADYIGVAVHCAKGSTFCSSAKGVKFGEKKPTPTAVTDLLPNEPGGYASYQALFGARYVAPQIGAGKPNLKHNGYEVTNAKGNLVDLNGSEIDGAFLNNHPGFPGFSPTASQTLAYMADYLEAGVPVVSTYMADIHEPGSFPSLDGKGGVCANANNTGDILGSGDPCYLAQAKLYNQAFGEFFKRLAADGITAKNTLFVISSDEGDHEASANVGRALQPTPANCNGVTVPCSYPAGTLGQLSTNVRGLLAAQKHDTTSFSVQADVSPSFFVTGNPAAGSPTVRHLEHDVATLTAHNPYTGTTQDITNYIADPTEEAILHMVNADPARTPSFTDFARPDYYLYDGGTTCSGSCVQMDPTNGWDHGAYSAEINTNWVGFAGPGVKHAGLDGSAAAKGPNSAGPDSGQVTVVQSHTKGTWVDEADIRPTIMYLSGLRDDYVTDGRVITQIVKHPNHALRGGTLTALSACYKQLDSSVGQFGAYTLIASTRAVNSHAAGDGVFKSVNSRLFALDQRRDALANAIKHELFAAEFFNLPQPPAHRQIAACRKLIGEAAALAASA